MIPVCDLKRQYLSLKDEIDAAMQAVAANSQYILGPNVKALEAEVAEFCGCQWGVGVGNGTDALHLALRALKIGPGDEVITTPFTFVATTEAIGIVGAKPVFVDIDPATMNMNVEQIESALTARTKAILPVHLYGQPCDMDPIMELAGKFGLYVVEDCAQAIGATYKGRPVGSFGDAGCLSFFPSKNLGCFGDGGMVVTNNQEVFERVEMLRRHGGRVKYYHEELGLNSRLDELQAAVLRVKLARLSRWCELRRRYAYRYNELLAGVSELRRPVELTPFGGRVPTHAGADGNGLLSAVYHQYTIQVENREAVCERLKERGVGHAIYYPVPLHLQQVHADLGHKAGSFPHAEHASDRCLSLPMFPELEDREIEAVTGIVRAVLEQGDLRTPGRAA
jgi:dTDP-4-amino-4,6-dideoxygalactose transaminase